MNLIIKFYTLFIKHLGDCIKGALGCLSIKPISITHTDVHVSQLKAAVCL
jgi:hypothetical protein